MKYVASCIMSLLLLLQQNSRAQAPAEKTLLWQVSGKGITRPSYLFGTYHLLCAGDLPLSDPFKQAFAATQSLYLEVNMSEMEQQAAMLTLMALPKGITISSLMDKQSYDSVSTLFTRYTNTPFILVDHIKPMLLSALLFPAMMNCETQSPELVLTGMAKQQGMQLNGLETLAFQARIFDSIPFAMQAEELKKAVLGFDSLKIEEQAMVNLYKQKDLPALYNTVLQDTTLNRFEEMMLFRRNASWAPVLARAMQEKPCFVAVGAAHLGGDKGIIALLRKNGFTIKPVTY